MLAYSVDIIITRQVLPSDKFARYTPTATYVRQAPEEADAAREATFDLTQVCQFNYVRSARSLCLLLDRQRHVHSRTQQHQRGQYRNGHHQTNCLHPAGWNGVYPLGENGFIFILKFFKVLF